MKAFKTKTIAVLILIAVIFPICFVFNTGVAQAADSAELVDPTVAFTDFKNGTTLLVVEYPNGTKDVVSETIQTRTAKLHVTENVTDQTLKVELPTSMSGSSNAVPATEDLMVEQEVLMGFTYAINATRWVGIPPNIVAYVRAGVDIDIGFGIRLPVRISLEYPEQMIAGHDYEIYAKLTPIDRPNFDEFLCKFKVKAWVQTGGLLLPDWYASWGPDYDWSKSFATPIGPTMKFPLPSFEMTIFDSKWVLPWPPLLNVNLVIDPQLGSDRITARAKAGGDAIGESNITWSAPDQRVPFTVRAGNYGPSDYAEIELSDFKYYFSIFKLHFGLKFDFASWIDWLTGDPQIGLFTVDMSWLTEGLYLGMHQGTDGTVDVSVLVTRPRYAYGIIDQVNVGNLASETGHSMLGWGPIRYYDDDNFRTTWYPNEGTSTYARGAKATLFRKEFSTIKRLCLRAFDGSGDDSFDVYVQVSRGRDWTDWRKIYHYTSSSSVRCWVIHRISFPEDWRFANKIRVTIVATGNPWFGFKTHGQLAVDRIGLLGCIETA